MKDLTKKNSSSKVLSSIKYFLFLNLGILMMATGIYFFKAPNGFATGGVSGISIILAQLFPVISQATYMLAINIVLLIVGVIVLGRQCGLLTIYCSIMMSMENWVFEMLVPLDGPLTEYTLLELVYAVMLTGVGAAIIFKCNASSGGTDIIALILKKYTHMNVGEALLFSDFVIATASFFAYRSITVGLFAMLGLFAKVFVVDDILDSINMCKAFTIITTKTKEIEEFIMKEMKHGATVQTAEGAYSGEEKNVIITVCKRTEAVKLRRKIKEIDPHSFIIITKTSEIMGKGFRDV